MSQRTINILLVDDSEADIATVRKALEASAGLQLTVAQSLSAARASLQESRPDLAIISLQLPDGQGAELLTPTTDRITFPTLLLADPDNLADAVAAMQNGALDYLIKSESTLADMPRIIERTLREWGHIEKCRKIEAELRERDQQYQVFFEANHSAMLLIDPENAFIVDANQAACSFYGHTLKELTSKKITDINTLPRDQIFAEMEKAKVEQRQYFNFKHRLASGDVREVEVYSGPVSVGGRNLLYSIVHDITQRKQAEAALLKSEAHLKATHDNIAAGIALVDNQGIYTEINERYAQMLGYASDEIIGKTPVDVTFADDQEVSRVQLDKLISGEIDSYRLEKRYVRKNGSIFWVDFSATRILNEDNEIEAIVGVFIDITEQKAVESKLREANRELDAFVYTVSHDLRSPLTPIIGYANLMIAHHKEQLDAKALGYLHEIKEQGLRMVALLEDLLSLAKVGHIDKLTRPVNVKKVVQEVVNELSCLCADANINIEIGKLTAAYIPKTLLGQIFNNLIGNAIRYTANKATSIIIGEELTENRVRYFVRDNGPGIDPDERSNIFEVFYRGSTGRDITGTGVGLAVVRKIAQLYAGKAWVEETPGGGSTFWVEMDNCAS